MSKERREEQARPAEPETPAVAADSVSRWLAVVALVVLLIGAGLFATAESRRKAAYIRALNTSRVSVKETEDGFQEDFAEISIDTNRTEYSDLQGKCNTEPQLALAIYRELLSGDKGTKEGQILACRMAYFLIQDGKLNTAENAEVLRLLVAQLDPAQSKEVRKVAQATLSQYRMNGDKVEPLSQLIAIRDVEKSKAFEKLPDPPANVKDGWEVQTRVAQRQSAKVLIVRWSGVDACKAWWDRYGERAAWDEQLKLFMIRAD